MADLVIAMILLLRRSGPLPFFFRLTLFEQALYPVVMALGALSLADGVTGYAALLSWFGIALGTTCLGLVGFVLAKISPRLRERARDQRGAAGGGPSEPHPSGGPVSEVGLRSAIARSARRKRAPIRAQIAVEKRLRAMVLVYASCLALLFGSLSVVSISSRNAAVSTTLLLIALTALSLSTDVSYRLRTGVRLQVLKHLAQQELDA